MNKPFRFNYEQIKILERIFEETNYVTYETCKRIGRIIQADPYSVKNWFVRARKKKGIQLMSIEKN